MRTPSASSTTARRCGISSAKNGAVEQSNFNNYPVARMPEAPRKVNVHIVPSTELPATVPTENRLA